MRIDIAQKLLPFSHTPAFTCLIPFTFWQVQCFPTLLRFESLYPYSSKKSKEVKLKIAGPVRDFTVVQDLEKGRICVFGHSPDGYFRYYIEKDEKGICITFEKFPLEKPQREYVIEEKTEFSDINHERLSLGMHKKLDWDLAIRRQDLKEIFPVWLRLTNMMPRFPIEEKFAYEGTASLLVKCEEVISERQMHGIVPAFINLFNAGFSGLFAPRLFDDLYQGLTPHSPQEFSFSSLYLLSKSAPLIRSLFFQENGDEIALLPILPPDFHAGRFLKVQTTCGEEISFEWSKKLLRRVIWKTADARHVHLRLQKSLSSFRLRHHLKDRGKLIHSQESFSLPPFQTIYLDRFQK